MCRSEQPLALPKPWLSLFSLDLNTRVTSTAPYRVRVVVDPTFGDRLASLPAHEPVWVIDSPATTPVAHRLWRERPAENHLTGITTFKPGGNCEDPKRFKKVRDVGAYAGLCPRRDQSGESDPQLRISKRGDAYLRRLLVSAAQYILGPFGPQSALREYGLRLAADGTTRAKKRAVVAVARKLCVLLLSLWKNQSPYQPYPA